MPINHQIQLRNPIHFCTHPWHHDQQKTGRASFCAIRIVLQGPSISTRSRELVAAQSQPAVLTGPRVGFSPGTRTKPGELASAVRSGAEEARRACPRTLSVSSRNKTSQCDTQNPYRHLSPPLFTVAQCCTLEISDAPSQTLSWLQRRSLRPRNAHSARRQCVNSNLAARGFWHPQFPVFWPSLQFLFPDMATRRTC